MTQNFDYNGLYERPTLVLVNPNRREIGVISAPVGLNMSLRYNNISEMTFTVYKDSETIDEELYSKVRKMRMIHVLGMGYFPIYEVIEHFESGVPYKEVKCYSAEYLLNYKPVNVTFTTTNQTTGSVLTQSWKFWDDNEIYRQSTLMYNLFNGFYDWTFDFSDIDPTLSDKYRSFSDSSTGLYGFLQDYVAEAYDCVFIYDIENFKVHAYKMETIANYSDIILTFDNLVQNAQIDELSDTVNTVLAVSGGGGLVLSSINPTGTNNIYKFDYYLSEDWIGEDVYSVDQNGDTRYFGTDSMPPAVATGVDSSGNVTYAEGYGIGDPIPFAYRVMWWEKQVSDMVLSGNTEGSYGWMVTQKGNLQAELLTVQTDYDLNKQYGDIAQQALTAIQQQESLEQLASSETTVGSESITITKKKTLWESIGGIVFAVLGIAVGGALIYFSGGLAAAPVISTVASALGLTSAATTTLIAGVGTGIVIGSSVNLVKNAYTLVQTLKSSNQSTASASKPVTAGKTQYQALSVGTENNLKWLQGGKDVGDGGYITKIDSESATNILTCEGQPTSYINQYKYYVSNVWDGENSTDMAVKFALKPNVNISEDLPQHYSIYVLNNKIDAIDTWISEQIAIWGYNTFFSDKERAILEPFFIQSDYSDTSFARNSVTTVNEDTQTYDIVLTSQGYMMAGNYSDVANGYYFSYRAWKGTSVENLSGDVLSFDNDAFRNYMGLDKSYATTYYLVYNSTTSQFDLKQDCYIDTATEKITGGTVVKASFPISSESGITKNNVTYTKDKTTATYTYQDSDFAYIYLFDPDIQLIDNNTMAVQLATQAYESLDKVCEPAFSFSISANNFLFQEKFKDWTAQIGFGSTTYTQEGDYQKYLGFGTIISVQIDDDMLLEPWLQEINIDYDNPDNISLTFGNKYNLGSQEWTGSELFSNVTRTVSDMQREQSRYIALLDTDDMSNSITSITMDIDDLESSMTTATQNIQTNSTTIRAETVDRLSQIENLRIAGNLVYPNGQYLAWSSDGKTASIPVYGLGSDGTLTWLTLNVPADYVG